MELLREAGFKEVEQAYVVELLEFHGKYLTSEDLMQLEQQRAREKQRC